MKEDPSFSVTMKLHEQKIYRAISRYVSDACTVEDLVQITFLKAWVGRETFKGDSDYSTWLYRIAINTALNFIASEKTRPRGSCYDPLVIERIPDAYKTESTAITNEEMNIIYRAVNDLPEEMRRVMVLSVIYALKYDEIANTLRIPIGTVRSRIHRARYLLRKSLAYYN